jgi:hypothetical protein
VVDAEDSVDLAALSVAYMMLQSLRSVIGPNDGDPGAPIAAFVNSVADQSGLVRGLAVVIDELVWFVDEAERIRLAAHPATGGQHAYDVLHVVGPAVISRLAYTSGVTPQHVPVMAAALTAAVLGQRCHQWRSVFGPLDSSEAVAWALTAWYLCSIIDYLRDRPGYALYLIGTGLGIPRQPPRNLGRAQPDNGS